MGIPHRPRAPGVRNGAAPRRPGRDPTRRRGRQAPTLRRPGGVPAHARGQRDHPGPVLGKQATALRGARAGQTAKDFVPRRTHQRRGLRVRRAHDDLPQERRPGTEHRGRVYHPPAPRVRLCRLRQRHGALHGPSGVLWQSRQDGSVSHGDQQRAHRGYQPRRVHLRPRQQRLHVHRVSQDCAGQVVRRHRGGVRVRHGEG